MIETIDERRVKNFVKKNNPDPDFQTWTRFPLTQDLIFILKEIVNENSSLKKQIRDLKGELTEEETEKISEEVTKDIYEPMEETNLGFMDEMEEPEEVSEFTCKECSMKFPNKGLLKAHMKLKHGEGND